MSVAGVDISGAAAHVAVLSRTFVIESVSLRSRDDLERLADELVSCDVVAIDSPDRWSSGTLQEHADLSPKFIAARCAEYALARDHRYWVPWVTPIAAASVEPRYGWMRAGMRLFELLRQRHVRAIEVYPNSVFRHLAGGAQLAKKSTATGVVQRAALLASSGIVAPHLEMWSHDGLDAAAAALVAAHSTEGTAVSVTCGHDGSEMWLPKRSVEANHAEWRPRDYELGIE